MPNDLWEETISLVFSLDSQDLKQFPWWFMRRRKKGLLSLPENIGLDFWKLIIEKRIRRNTEE